MTKCIIVGFDGLRQDSVTPDVMPNLYDFIHRGCWCRGHRAVFPVETYVNHPSIFTGALPRRHGLIANAYYNRPGTVDTPMFEGSSVESLEANDRQGGLFGVPTLGDYLGQAGRTMRVIGSNSCGSTRLKHHRADRYPGHLNLAVRDINTVLPASELPAWSALHGPGYPLTLPDEAGSRAVIESFFNGELSRGLADLTVLWIGEPDHSCHHDGPTGPRTLAALAHADQQFGLIVDWWRANGRDVQLLALSDHGHVVIERHSDIRGALATEGLRVLSVFDLADGADIEDADLVMAGLYCGGLWSARPGDMEAVLRAAEILQNHPDTGMLFSSRPELTDSRDSAIFSEALVLTDHQRAPDLRFITRGDPATGLIAMEPHLPIGGGAHGGLLPQELFCLCAWGGDAFRRKTVNDLPSGPADVAATVLHLLGFDQRALAQLDGRVLHECFNVASAAAPEMPQAEVFTAAAPGFKQVLHRSRYDGRVYLDQGYREK